MVVVWMGALVIGITLGLLGSGGSAITVPVLVYLVGHGAKQSIAESMAIVGLIAVVAAIPYARSRQIDWHSVLYFGIPGMLGTLCGAWLGGIAADALQLTVFGGVLIMAAYAMLRQSRAPAAVSLDESSAVKVPRATVWHTVLQGVGVGGVTGFVGVGGGFLIVPALVVLKGLPIRTAIGTSLVIIALNTVVGFAKYEHYLVSHQLSVDKQLVLVFVAIGIVGSLLGRSINARLNQQLLKQVFAIFLVVLGGLVIVIEGRKLMNAYVIRMSGGPASVSVSNDGIGRPDSIRSFGRFSDVTQVLLRHGIGPRFVPGWLPTHQRGRGDRSRT